MEKQNLEVVNVEIKDASVDFELLNEAETEVIEMTLYKQSYNKDDNSWNDDDEVFAKFMEDINTLGVDNEDNLETLIGEKLELFVKEDKGTAHIEEPKSLNLSKATLDMVGDDADGTIISVMDYETNKMIVVELPDGTRYGANYNYGKYNKRLGKYLVSKVDLVKKKNKFKTETKTDWEDSESLVGKQARIDFKKFNMGGDDIPFVAFKKVLG